MACAGSQQLSVPGVRPATHCAIFFQSFTFTASYAVQHQCNKLGHDMKFTLWRLHHETANWNAASDVMCEAMSLRRNIISVIYGDWLVEAGRSSTTTVRWSSQISCTAKMIFRLSLILGPVSQCDEPRPKLSPNSLSSITVVIFQMGQLKIAQCGVGPRHIHATVFHFVSVFQVVKSALSKCPNFRNQKKLLSWFL